MVVTNQRRDLLERRVLHDHVSANVRMAPHRFPLFFGEGPRLVENVITHADFSKVVKRAGRANELTLSIPEFKVLTQCCRQLGHSN